MTFDELRAFLADARARLLATVEGVEGQRLTRRPTPERWSPLEVLEHVALAEEWFTAIVQGLVEEGRERGLTYTEGAPRDLDALAALARQIDPRQPLQAAEFVEPTGEVTPEGVRERLSLSREGLLAVVPALEALDADQLRFRHPTAHFELNAYQWVHLSGLHDRTHARQIREALASA